MDETVRKRVSEMREERAAARRSVAAVLEPLFVADAASASGGRRVIAADDVRAALLLGRQVRLGERLHALGLTVTLGEMPDADDDLADLERECDKAETLAT